MSDPTANQPVEEASGGVPAAGEPTGEAGHQSWTDEYVHGLRDEAASYRTKHKPFEEAFDGYDESEVQTLLDVAKALKTDPISAANWFENTARAIKGVPGEEAPPAPADAADKPLTKAELDAYLREREEARSAQQAQVAQVEAVNAEIKELGYDPESVQGVELMWLAVNQTGGDLKAADEVLKAQRQAIIDEYVESIKKGAQPGVTPSGGIPSQERTIKSLEDAHKAASERLRAM